MDMKQNFDLAIENITKYGDTDIFPFPIENHIFYDKKQETASLLFEIDKDFNTYIEKYPPVNISTCVPLGYVGFRWATQIDPIWNAYYLALVLSIAPKFESQRIPKEENIVFSYRFNPSETGSLFDRNYNWVQFQKRSLELAKEEKNKFVLSCDIANFYHRISHHNLQNAIERLGIKNDVPYKIRNIIQKFSETVSSGLPIGGPASRILAELALNNIDQHLKLHGVRFCRFVDDFNIFVGSEPEALSILNMLTQYLMKNEVLSLQQNKTEIYSSDEFCNVIEKRLKLEDSNTVSERKASFMSLNLHFDPYSETAVEDYETIKKSIENYDVMGLLIEELRKNKIHQAFSKQLIRSFIALDDENASKAFLTIMDNLELLYPILPTVMISIFGNFDRLEETTKDYIMKTLCENIINVTYIIQNELIAAYIARIIGKKSSPANQSALVKLYGIHKESILVRITIIRIMAHWKIYTWVRTLKPDFKTMNSWERRMFIISSHILGEEGRHWREHNGGGFLNFEKLCTNWADEKKTNADWRIPL
jgi:hypothetical protein